MKAAVVGFGKLGLLHTAVLKTVPGCEVLAVADEGSPVLNALRNFLPGINIFENHAQLLAREKPDVVYITTPTDSHVAIALDCVRANIPVFIEKPLSLTAAQADPLLKQLTLTPTTNMVGYMNRYLEPFALAQRIIHSGSLGKLQTFRSSMYVSQVFRANKGWRFKKNSAGGGVLLTQNSHLIDLLYWFFGPIASVSTNTQTLYSEGVEDTAHVYFNFANGLTGFLDASWSARHTRTLTTSIYLQGTNGTLEVSDDEVKLFLDEGIEPYQPGWTLWTKPDLFSPVPFEVAGAHYTKQTLHFLSCVTNKQKPPSDVFSAHCVQRAIDAMYLSAERRGTAVEVKAA